MPPAFADGRLIFPRMALGGSYASQVRDLGVVSNTGTICRTVSFSIHRQNVNNFAVRSENNAPHGAARADHGLARSLNRLARHIGRTTCRNRGPEKGHDRQKPQGHRSRTLRAPAEISSPIPSTVLHAEIDVAKMMNIKAMRAILHSSCHHTSG